MSRAAARARLFVAVDPPAGVQDELAAWARSATAGLFGASSARGALRLLDPELLHITICFLGSRPVAEIDDLAGVLPQCAAHACELSVSAPLWLPPRRPRALALAIHDGEAELGRLHAELVRALCQVSDWEPERRRFRAHVTVARLRPQALGRSLGAPPLPVATPRLRFMAESLALYRSHLGPAGASYEQLASCILLPAGG